MMRHDVVELAGDAGALFHDNTCTNAFTESCDREPAPAYRFADGERGEEKKQWGRAPERGMSLVKPSTGEGHERKEQRRGHEQAAANDQMGDQEERDAEARDPERGA